MMTSGWDEITDEERASLPARTRVAHGLPPSTNIPEPRSRVRRPDYRKPSFVEQAQRIFAASAPRTTADAEAAVERMRQYAESHRTKDNWV